MRAIGTILLIGNIIDNRQLNSEFQGEAYMKRAFIVLFAAFIVLAFACNFAMSADKPVVNKSGGAGGGIKWESQSETEKRREREHHKSDYHHHRHKHDVNQYQSSDTPRNIINNKASGTGGGTKLEPQRETEKRRDSDHHKSEGKYHDPFDE